MKISGLTTIVAMTFAVTNLFAQSLESTVTSAEGVVLLRNGQTMEGNITRAGDYYLLTKGVTSEVRLPAAAVELVCESLEALYQHKRAEFGRGDFADHLALSRWCLQHDLVARAADQVLMAFSLDPNGTGLELAERELLATVRRAAEPTPAISKSRSPTTLHEIETAIESLPSGAVEHFVTSVQPLLMNRCATNGCHGTAGKSDFTLLRPATRQSLTRRMTQRNLFRTLGFVNRTNPRQSQLLTASVSPHGGREAIFSEAEAAQVQILNEWVGRLVGQPIADLPATVTRPPSALLQTRKEAIDSLGSESAPLDAEPVQPPTESADRNQLGEDYQPRDPFDAEVFNRRHHRDINPPK